MLIVNTYPYINSTFFLKLIDSCADGCFLLVTEEFAVNHCFLHVLFDHDALEYITSIQHMSLAIVNSPQMEKVAENTYQHQFNDVSIGLVLHGVVIQVNEAVRLGPGDGNAAVI
jgi:hypothetical protein